MTEQKRSQAWDVYDDESWIDRVFMVKGMTAEEVKQGLVDHDGYSANIRVESGR